MASAYKRPNLQEHGLPYLAEEVIEEIVVRLPLKSIVRFNSVCKNWYSLIQSRSFIEYHRAHHHDDLHRDEFFFSRNHSKRLVYTTTDEPYVVSCFSKSSIMKRTQSTKLFDLGILRRTLTAYRVDPPLMKFPFNLQSGVHVLGPLNNGISCVITHECVRSTIDGDCRVTEHSKLALCNLGTNQFNFIPYPFIRAGKWFPQYKNWDFSMLEFLHHFGFCSIDNQCGVAVDYKLVAIESNHKVGRLRACVYSHLRGSWKLVYDLSSSSLLSGLIITQNLNEFPGQALLHGCCHWMAGRNSDDSNHVILQFDMAEEVFGLIEAPPEDEYSPSFPLGYHLCSNVFVLDGCIAALISFRKKAMVERIDVWRMMEYGVSASWKKIFSHQINGLFISRFLGMSFHNNTNDIERIFFEHDLRCMMSCDGYEVKEHRSFKHHWACWKPFGLSVFLETLEPAGIL